MRDKFIFYKDCKGAEIDELKDFIGYNRGVRDTLFNHGNKGKKASFLQIEYLKAQLSFPNKVVSEIFRQSLIELLRAERRLLLK